MTSLIDMPTILIVGDTPSTLDPVVSLFKDNGYRVVIAEDGEQGLQRAALVCPNLILLDVMMSGTDGFEICRQLKTQESTRDTPVIFMTSLASVEHKAKGFQAGAVDYLTTPLQVDEVMARVQTHLKLHAAQKKIAEYNKEQEYRVSERTAELESRERKKLEEELTERQRELHALAESSPGMMGSFYLKPDGAVCMPYVSSNIYEIFGLRPEAVAEDAAPLMRLNHPDDAQRVMDSIAESARTLNPWRCEYRINHPTKGERWMEGHTRPHPHPKGGTIWYGYVHDITERKRMEAELKASEARYRYNANLLRTIIESPSDSVSIYAFDRDYRLLAFNSRFRNAAKRLWQADIELGMSLLEVINSETLRAIFKQGADHVLAGNHGFLESNEVRIENGKEVLEWHDNYGSPIRDENGNVVGMTVFVLNTTERKEAEQKLKESLEFSEGIINAIPDLLFEVNRDGRYLNVWTQNPELLAAQREQLLGKTAAEVLSPENAAAAMRAIREADEKGSSLIEDICIELPIGKRWFSHSLSKKPGSTPGEATFLVLSRDITERKRLEHELKESEARLRALIDNLPLEFWAMDANLCYIMQNSASIRNYGDVVGKGIKDLGLPQDVEKQWIEQDREVLSGTILHEEYEKEVGGEKRFFESMVAPVTLGDEVVGIVGVGIDITERKQLEVAREAALTEAQRLADLRSEFIAHMSHELRTPLNGILGYAQMLGRDERLSEKQLASIDVIRHSGEHLLSLIEDILDLARIESGRLELDMGDIPLRRLINSVAGIVGVKAQQENLDLVCEYAPDLPDGVRGDERRLRQVLLNLLSNAIKFTERGKVVLRIERMSPSRLVFSVSDTGVGIDAADCERIFQSFEQVGQARSKIGGTGLGLTISRQLVRLMGSDIEIESRPGAGSTFRFELDLPVAKIEPELLHKLAASMQPSTATGEAQAVILAPPLAEIYELHRLALLGNMRDIVQQAEHIAALDARYRPFAEHLKRLAAEFQSKAILNFVEGFFP